MRVAKQTRRGSLTVEAYETLAPYYDAFTESYRHDAWLDALQRLACDHGLRARRALDVACGTGKSFVPLLERGYEVWACDLSPAMAARARTRHPDGDRRVLVCDVRDPLPLGGFDLVTWLDDAANYLLGDDEVVDAVHSLGAVLAPGGLLVFDVNTPRAYREAFAGERVVHAGEARLRWHGEPVAGELHHARLDVTDAGRTLSTTHVQRAHSPEEVALACRAAGLELAAVLGQHRGARLVRAPDELAHDKLVFVVRKGREA